MSNYDLQSQLSSLQNELNHALRINAELRNELSTIAIGVNDAHRQLEAYNNKIRSALENCSGVMSTSHHNVVEALALQGEIEKLYERFKHIELANKKIRACNNKKYYDFSNYRTVRKIVQGMMDNLDLQMISDKTISKAVEVQHLQNPDYWLTCVLISIMFWRSGNKPLADHAIQQAVNLDKKNSAVFYMLFNLRMGREKAALNWFLTYQECDFKGSDQRTFLMLFSLISKTLAEKVNDQMKTEISTFIQKVIDASMQASDYSEDQMIARIRTYFNKMQTQSDSQSAYKLLKKYCAESDLLTEVMMQAKNNLNILQFILKTAYVPAEEKNTFLKNYINELIELPNPAEKDVYDEIAYNELIIRLEGDAKTAEKQFAAERVRQTKDLNLISEMIDLIYTPDVQDLNGQIRLSMFVLTKPLQIKAVQAHVENYRRRQKTAFPITLGEYSAVVNFDHEEEEYTKISDFFLAQKEAGLSAVKNGKAYLGFGLAFAAVVGFAYAGVWLLILAAAGAVYGTSVLLSNHRRKNEIVQDCETKIRTKTEILRGIFKEFKQYQTALSEADGDYDRIIYELGKI